MDAADKRYPVMNELIGYWLAHPQASDTLEGICQWWLSGCATAPMVEQALDWLVVHGTVVAHRAADGRVRFRLANAMNARAC